MKRLRVKDWMQADVITGNQRMGLLDAHKMMRDRKIRRLPVLKRNKKLVGMVTRSDIRRAEPSDATSLNVWEMNYLLAKLQLKDIMTTRVITCGPEDTIKTAASLMQQHKIGALPVMDKEDRVVGIITESDIFRILIAWFNEEIGENS